ncbi:dehydratase [Bosea sp. Root670]|jgi:acyl dehydratase|uniref:Acyl dehydratase n=1 Tax=Bosea robiniae TaxID=1036780 RepID=A0ABY0NU41_9HYPH|nr:MULTISPECIES: MaoC/PaaZ C-terminal domain-containing protein [Bosea]KRE01221.1 dehydratase [Bosea sp. Root670]TQI73959.1 acyl dehydratase [Bosea sp. AK1]SDG14309.1 Acyl dehydratase [Bosea robiniae]
MSQFHVSLGQKAQFAKTVSESDVYLFAGITGDLAPNHVNKAYMEKSSYGRLQAHGALIIGYMSAASSIVTATARDGDETPVSLGYDRIRIVGPVFFGDTVTVDYEIDTIDAERRRATGAIRVTNQDGELVAVATHILKWVPNTKH